MKVKFKFRIEDLVRDKYSGFEGKVTSLIKWVNGCVQIGIQPESVDKITFTEATYIDQPQLELVASTISSKPDSKKVNFKFDLGEFTKDNFSNFEGYVMAVAYGPNGNRYVLQPKSLESGKLLSTVVLEEERLSSIHKDQVVIKKKKPGGPNKPVPSTKL